MAGARGYRPREGGGNQPATASLRRWRSEKPDKLASWEEVMFIGLNG